MPTFHMYDSSTSIQIHPWEYRYSSTGHVRYTAVGPAVYYYLLTYLLTTCVAYELKYQCPPERRSTYAALSPEGGPSPFTTSELQRKFNEWMEFALGPAEAGLHSFHALRATLATALNTPNQDRSCARSLICRPSTRVELLTKP